MFATSGEGLRFNDIAFSSLRGILRKKGATVISEHRYVMPYNIIFRHPDKMVKQMLTYSRAEVELQVGEIAKGEKYQPRIMPFYRLLSYVLRIEWPYSRLQGPHMKVDLRKCVHCGLCVRDCPFGNIKTVNGKFVFGKNCALCMRCVMHCPKEAISIGILNGWRVSGAYRFKSIDKNHTDINFTKENKKGRWKLYQGYYKRLDKALENQNIKPEDYASGFPEESSSL